MSFLVQTVETKVRQCGHINHASQCQSTTAVQPLKVFPSVHAVGFLHLSLHERGKARTKTSMNESVRHHHSPSIFQDGRCHQTPQTMRLLDCQCLLPWIPSQLGRACYPYDIQLLCEGIFNLPQSSLKLLVLEDFISAVCPAAKWVENWRWCLCWETYISPTWIFSDVLLIVCQFFIWAFSQNNYYYSQR